MYDDFDKAVSNGYYAINSGYGYINPPVSYETYYGAMHVFNTSGGIGGNPIVQVYFGLYPKREIIWRIYWDGYWNKWERIG